LENPLHAPPILKKKLTFRDILANTVSKDSAARTVGDPSGRAKFARTQKAALAAEAKSRGFYRHGTPDAYTANLLVDRGLIVTKQADASIATLDAAVRRGGMIIANIDARHLWGGQGA